MAKFEQNKQTQKAEKREKNSVLKFDVTLEVNQPFKFCLSRPVIGKNWITFDILKMLRGSQIVSPFFDDLINQSKGAATRAVIECVDSFALHS